MSFLITIQLSREVRKGWGEDPVLMSWFWIFIDIFSRLASNYNFHITYKFNSDSEPKEASCYFLSHYQKFKSKRFNRKWHKFHWERTITIIQITMYKWRWKYLVSFFLGFSVLPLIKLILCILLLLSCGCWWLYLWYAAVSQHRNNNESLMWKAKRRKGWDI